MAKFDIYELNYITAGKTQNTFNVTYCYTNDGMIRARNKPAELSVARTNTFFGDIGEYETMSDRYNSNKESFYDITHGIIVHNLYNINKTKIKTTAKKYSSSLTSTEYQDIYIPYISSDFIHLCQFKSNAYGLTHEHKNNLQMPYINMNNASKFDTTYHSVISSDEIHTFLYPRPQELNSSCSSYTGVVDIAGELSNCAISTIFQLGRDLRGIQYNYIVELPENSKHIDYTKGYILGDAIATKNHLNYQYSISADSDYNLSGCREYCNIDVCGNQLYLTYRDNVDYSVGSISNVTYFDGTSKLSVNAYQMEKIRKNYNYQHVEVIDSINKFDGDANGGHKSSMFSIRLFDTGLNEATIPETAKQKLRQNVINNVRTLVENIIPANTQLFNIYFDGK